MTSEKAWVTLATNDTYSLGALVLAHSLKKVKTSFKLVVLISSNVSYSMRGLLQGVYNEVKEVNLLDSGDADNLRLLARPELGVTFTKLHCWKLTQYEKCVFLDADTLVLQNCDELFDREELSAAPDVGWPDCFNSGVFVFKPSDQTYQDLIKFALTHGSFDGGDQGLLNMFFSGWSTGDSSKRLPFLFNLSSAAIYSYLPAFKWYGKGVKIVHFIGSSKPWLQTFNPVTRQVQTEHSISHLNNFLQYWWDVFCAQVYPYLSPEMTRLLLRKWITPQNPFKNYSNQNIHSRFNIINQHDDAIVLETVDQRGNERHFVFTDPWDEYESSLVDNIENFDSWSKSNEYIPPPVIEDVTLVENHDHKYYTPKSETNIFQNTSNDRDAIIFEPDKSVDSADFFEHFLNHPEYIKIDHPQSDISKTQNYHDDSHKTEIHKHKTEIHKPIMAHNQSDQTETLSSNFTVNTNFSLSPSAVDVLPEEKEISNYKVDLNEEAGLAQSLSQMKLEEPTPEQLAQEDLQRRLNWEQGNIDYMGKDSFDNIWSKISQSISQVEDTLVSDTVLGTAGPATSTVSPTRVTSTASVPSSPVSVPAEPTQQSTPSGTPADPPKAESPTVVAQSEIKPSTSIPEPKEIVEEVEKAEVPASPSQRKVESLVDLKTHPSVTSSQKPAEPSVAPSSVSQPQPEAAPACTKPSSVEKQHPSGKETAPKKDDPLQQETKPSTESSSITPSSPKTPEAPIAVPDLIKKSASASSTAATSSTPPTTDPAPIETKTEPASAPAQSTPTAQETKSKQPQKSGGGKKK